MNTNNLFIILVMLACSVWSVSMSIAAEEVNLAEEKPVRFVDPTRTELADLAESGNDKFEAVVSNFDSESFQKGYEAFINEDYLKAADYFYNLIINKTADDENYEWAEFFLGISLSKLDFSHAAADTLARVVIRKPNQKIVAYILELFEVITRTMPHERETLIDQVIVDHEYGFLDQELNNFINYYQGEFDWSRGFYQWGDSHFQAISSGSYYYYKFLYRKALYRVHEGQIDDAVKILKQIILEAEKADDLRDETRQTLARLLYEKGQYQEADLLYIKVKKNIVDQAGNLMERAWVHYRLGNAERAMGLLYAFKAPSFENYFSPEYFILKSFIYKNVCHYQAALNVVEEFKEYYGETLEKIYQRKKPVENHRLLTVMLGRKKIKRVWEFLNLLEMEKEHSLIFRDKHRILYKYLLAIYEMQIDESRKTLRDLIDKEYESMANELLKYEEETYLLEYEVNLDISERVRQYHYAFNEETKEASMEGKVSYEFQGEFWNDELANYTVTLPNKCADMEEWGVFFE